MNNVSREETIKNRISSMSWDQGVQNFIINEIPFSFGTGKVLARKMSGVIKYIKKQNKHCYELGAGTGYLSKHILDLLKKDENEYKKIHFHISDKSLKNIEQIQSLKVFEQHKQKASFHVLDATDLHFPEKQEPDLIFMSYILDSLNVRQIFFNETDIEEIRVIESMDSKIPILDTTCFPPHNISDEQVKSSLKNETFIKKYGAQLNNKIIEKTKNMPITEVLDISKDEKTMITQFIEYLRKHKDFGAGGIVNISTSIHNVLKQLKAVVDQGTIVMIHDFGLKDISTNQMPIVEFGLVISYPVCFAFVEYFAKKHQLEWLITSTPEGHNQIGILYKCETYPDIKEWFEREVNTRNTDKEQILQSLDNIKESGSELEAQIKKEMARLSEDDQACYFLQVNIGKWLYEKKEYELALKWMHQTLCEYKEMAGPSYMLISRIYKEKKAFKEAKKSLKKVIEIAPNYADAYNELCLINIEMGEKKLYIENAIHYIKNVVDISSIWPHIHTILVFYIELDQYEKAQKLMEWIQETDKKTPYYIPVKDKEIFKKLFLSKT